MNFSESNLVNACRYTKRHGVFSVSLAAALKAYSLSVSFHSEPDRKVGGYERRCYAYARRVGVVGIFRLCCSTLPRTSGTSRLCRGSATEWSDYRGQMAARCLRAHLLQDGLTRTSWAMRHRRSTALKIDVMRFHSSPVYRVGSGIGLASKVCLSAFKSVWMARLLK